jgi:beta-lactamase superfamily II metal-dependent hydrolase
MDAAISGKAKFREASVLKVRFVDVAQGDTAIIETPQGRLLLLDGGEEEHLKNYVSHAWAHILRDAPLQVEAIIVSHGDADHFAGLTDLLRAARGHGLPMVVPKRVFHSGLVKAASSTAEKKLFGRTKMKDGQLYIVDLVDDLRTTPADRLNKPFKDWKAELVKAATANPNLALQRLRYGDSQPFDFLNAEGIQMQVLGPIVEDIDGVPGLPFLHSEGNAYSASHTINGHSIVLKMTYGNVRFLFGADMNRESEAGLLSRTRQDGISLAAEVLKVPHHGSADFDSSMLEAVRAVVSVVSSGDESEAKEYIHPRAGLVGALGRYSRPTVEKPLVYVTEMVAFFQRVGTATIQKTANGAAQGNPIPTSNAYIKKKYGIVHVRTDGERVLVACHSGKPGMKESYAFHVGALGQIRFEAETSEL